VWDDKELGWAIRTTAMGLPVILVFVILLLTVPGILVFIFLALAALVAAFIIGLTIRDAYSWLKEHYNR
jgi:hypothetical protein